MTHDCKTPWWLGQFPPFGQKWRCACGQRWEARTIIFFTFDIVRVPS